MTMLCRLVAATGSTTWAVTSGDQKYTVTLEQERCTQDCALECSQCNICLHMYSCTCYDHLIHGTICKHIHLVARTIPPEATWQGAPHTTTREETAVILQAIKPPPTPPSAFGRNRLLARLDDLALCVRECSNVEALSAVERHITAAISVLKAITSQAAGTLPDAPSQPSNKKMTVQRFKSTKKSRISAKV